MLGLKASRSVETWQRLGQVEPPVDRDNLLMRTRTVIYVSHVKQVGAFAGENGVVMSLKRAMDG